MDLPDFVFESFESQCFKSDKNIEPKYLQIRQQLLHDSESAKGREPLKKKKKKVSITKTMGS